MINMDFSERVLIDSNQLDWSPSPKQGVWRKRLARQEAEHGHATSVVWFEPGSQFNEHPHPKGEEIFVLEGTFSDHTGDYPAGSYLRNPEGFSHAPYATDGCKLFVKLCQFKEGDSEHITHANLLDKPDGIHELHRFFGERTQLLKLSAGTTHTLEPFVGFELFVMSGVIEIANAANDRLEPLSWLRSPKPTGQLQIKEDAVILLKQGHFTP